VADSKRYDEKAVSQILRRAAELELGGGLRARGGLTSTDIERVAEEAGLDPTAVRAAIAERERAPEPTAGLFGGPLRVRQARVLDAELDERGVEEVLDLAQHELGMFGETYRNGRTHTWSPKGVPRNLQVRVQVRDGRTEIVVDERLGPLAGALWGGVFGGVGGASIGLSVPLGLAAFGSVGAMIALLGAGLGGAFLLTRAIYKTMAGKRRAELTALADRLAAEGRAEAEAPALEDSAGIEPERDELPRGHERGRSGHDDDRESRRRRVRRSRD